MFRDIRETRNKHREALPSRSPLADLSVCSNDSPQASLASYGASGSSPGFDNGSVWECGRRRRPMTSTSWVSLGRKRSESLTWRISPSPRTAAASASPGRGWECLMQMRPITRVGATWRARRWCFWRTWRSWR